MEVVVEGTPTSGTPTGRFAVRRVLSEWLLDRHEKDARRWSDDNLRVCATIALAKVLADGRVYQVQMHAIAEERTKDEDRGDWDVWRTLRFDVALADPATAKVGEYASTITLREWLTRRSLPFDGKRMRYTVDIEKQIRFWFEDEGWAMRRIE